MASAAQPHPASLSLVIPDQAACPATTATTQPPQRVRLTVKQVHRELVLDFADPGGIGGTTTGSSLPDHRDPGAPELATPARLPPRGRRPRLPSRPVPFPRWQCPDVRYEEPGWLPGDWRAVLSPWWPALIPVNRAWASSSSAAIMSLTLASSGVSAGQA